MKNEKGFTLVEVLASLVIISLVLMSFMALFTNTNRLAVTNSEKLVVINLADAYLERLKADPVFTLNPTNSTPGQSFPPALGICTNKDYVKHPVNTKCKDISFNIPETINGKIYKVLFEFSQNPDEKSLSLLNIVVTVSAPDSNISSKVEGYMTYE